MEETATHKNMLRDFKAVKDNQLEQMIQVTGDESFGYTPMALKFILGQLQKFDPEVIVEGLEGVRLTDENGEISDKDEFKQFWKHIFLTSFKLLSYLDRKFMSGMTLFEPSIGSKYNEIMSTIRLSNEEFRLVVDSTWKVSFLEIGQIDSRKTYYLHRLSYTFSLRLFHNLVRDEYKMKTDYSELISLEELEDYSGLFTPEELDRLAQNFEEMLSFYEELIPCFVETYVSATNSYDDYLNPKKRAKLANKFQKAEEDLERECLDFFKQKFPTLKEQLKKRVLKTCGHLLLIFVIVLPPSTMSVLTGRI